MRIAKWKIIIHKLSSAGNEIKQDNSKKLEIKEKWNKNTNQAKQTEKQKQKSNENTIQKEKATKKKGALMGRPRIKGLFA